MNTPLILSLSPRAGGNSDAVASYFARSLQHPVPVERLCNYKVQPCLGCNACAGSGQCILADQDQVEEIYAAMDRASGLLVVAPVYFYHLPAQAKAWIDRSQSRYLGRVDCDQDLPVAHPSRPAYVILVAARTTGEKLFAGIMPTLRYFFKGFGFHIQDSLFLRGLDGPSDFKANTDAQAAVALLSGLSGW